LADELRALKQTFDSTKPAYKIVCRLQYELKESTIFFSARRFGGASMEKTQNYEVWKKNDQIASLKIESNLIDMELEIDKARLHEYSDAEFDAMEKGRKRIRTGSSPSCSSPQSGKMTISSKNLDDEIDEFLLSPNEQQPNRFAENLKRSGTADEQYEYWYTVALFGACIDVAYRDAKLGTDVKRSDVPSYASSNRKNRSKKSKRKLTGRKIDGIVYLIENLHEVGAIEGARSYAGVHDKKYLEEYFKMPKTLRDMLTDLVIAVDYDESKMNKFQVFGIIHLGLKIQFSRLWRAGGSITIFKKDPPLYEVPRKFSTDKFKIFLKFLVSIYKYKMIIKNNIQILYMEANGNTLLDELKDVGRPQKPPQITNYTKYFANAFATPRKSREKKIE
ncbi:18378_t:CDS:2, partial [Funneliformis geosporum]